MKATVRSSLAALAVTCALAVCAEAQQPDTTLLNEELHNIDALRAGDKTPFAEVEKRGLALLQQYGDKESQGKIYFTLAMVYAQSGPVTDKTIEYTEKALAYPLNPVKRLQMYCYWGDAIQVSHRGVTGEKLADARREAVMPYLQGLKEALEQNLPDVAPKRPKDEAQFITDTGNGPTDTDEYREMKRKQNAQIEAQRIFMFQQNMIRLRDTLTGQIAFMYSRMPFATEEIRDLAARTLQNEHEEQRLMTAVEKAVKARTAEQNAALDKQLTAALGKFMTTASAPGEETMPSWDPKDAMEKLDKPLQERLTAILNEVETVKPGMTRGELLQVCETEGGLSTRTQQTYVCKTCSYIKIDVKFRAVGEAKAGQNESAADFIEDISKPYVQWGIMD